MVAVILATATSASAALYSVTDIGTLGGEWSEATAINNAGEVTGSAQTNRPGRQAFRYRRGVLTNLGRTPRPGETSSDTWGNAINSTGDIVGGIAYPSSSRAEIFKANGSSSLVPCYPYCQEGPVAYGINDADEVVGGGLESTVPWLTNGEGKAMGLVEEAPNCAGPRPGGQAFAINALGEVVGESWVGRHELCGVSAYHAFLYGDGTMHDLGTLGGSRSRATALNERGTIVGYSEISGVTTGCGGIGAPPCREPKHAFSYHNGKMTDLGTLPGTNESMAYGVNDWSEIVGTSGSHAFLDFVGLMFDLNALIPAGSGWDLVEARGINDLGEIVGTGTHNGIKRGFILKPSWLWF